MPKRMLGHCGEELSFQRQVGNWVDVSDDTQRAERHDMQRQVNSISGLTQNNNQESFTATVNVENKKKIAPAQNFPLMA